MWVIISFHYVDGIYLFSLQVISSAAYLYDAVWLYAAALNRSISNGSNVINNADITAKIYGTTFGGKQTLTMASNQMQLDAFVMQYHVLCIFL